jgi:probable selenium-dependent hydroxylase accessory protein YqeC
MQEQRNATGSMAEGKIFAAKYCNSMPDALHEATMHLQQALELKHGEMVALIGAGGKTTTLFHLANELREAGGKILVTTTTKIFKPAKPHVDRLFLVEDISALLAELAKIPGPVTIGAGSGISGDGKLLGLPAEWLDTICRSAELDAILIEADGAASRGFKIPSETEPVIPKGCSTVIWIMAVKVIGKPWDKNWVHRPEQAMALLGPQPLTLVTVQQIVDLINHPLGCLKGVPPNCRRVALINQADSAEEEEQAEELASLIAPLGFERVIITSYRSDPPVKRVLLPARR